MATTAEKLSLAFELPRTLGLALALLYEEKTVSRSYFLTKMSGWSRKGEVTRHSVDRVINRLRNHLRPAGIYVETNYSIGFSLPKESYEIVGDAIYEYDLHYGRRDNDVRHRNPESDERILKTSP